MSWPRSPTGILAARVRIPLLASVPVPFRVSPRSQRVGMGFV